MRGLVVFDLDGTLIDSRQDLAAAANALIVERGGRALEVDGVARMVGEGAAKLVQRALDAAGLPPDVSTALPRFLDLYQERLLETTRLYDGVEHVVGTLSSSCTLAILTNKPLRATRAILAGLGIEHWFSHVLGGDGPHPRKPDPAGLLQLAAATGAALRATIMVGDSPVDLATASAAGTPAIVAQYGFGFRPGETTPARVEYARSPAEIPAAVGRLLP